MHVGDEEMPVFNKGKISEKYIHCECGQTEVKENIIQGKCPGELSAG